MTLRFGSESGVIGDTENKRTTFKKKSQNQVNRDQQRMERYNTRSNAKSDIGLTSEKRRYSETDDILHSDLGLEVSPVAEVTFTEQAANASLLCLNDSVDIQSPGAISVPGSSTGIVNTESEVQSVGFPEFPDHSSDSLQSSLPSCIGGTSPPPQSSSLPLSHEKLSSHPPKLRRKREWRPPPAIDTPIFREHLDSRPGVSWGAMHCHDCRSNVNKSAYHNIRTAFCDKCKLYFCENCLELEKLCFCDNSPVFIT